MTRIRTLLAVLAVAAAIPGGATGANEYVPFVTDFPKPVEQYVPFVTDFPRPATPASEPAPTGTTWGDVPVEGVGATFAALVGGALLLLHHRRQAARLGGC